MPHVKQVKAAKDYPQFGIKKGDLHYYTKMKTGPRSSRELRQKTPFKRSQLTSSPFLSALYDWEDSKSDVGSHEDIQGLADTIREIGEEERSKFDNMPEGLQQGDTGQMLEQRAEACETAATELEEIASEWEQALDEHTDLVEQAEKWADYVRRRDAGELEDGEEEPDEFDDSDYKERAGQDGLDVELPILFLGHRPHEAFQTQQIKRHPNPPKRREHEPFVATCQTRVAA